MQTIHKKFKLEPQGPKQSNSSSPLKANHSISTPEAASLHSTHTPSHTSFHTASHGFSRTTSNVSTVSNVSKQDVIFEKYIEVNGIKFKIVMINLKEIKTLQILVYNKPRNMLKKIFVKFQEILTYAKHFDLSLSTEKDASKLLTKIVKLLYFKEGELYIKELPFFKNLDEYQHTS